MGRNENEWYCIITGSQKRFDSEIGFGNESFLRRKDYLEKHKIKIIAYRSGISGRKIEGVGNFVDGLKEEKENKGEVNNLQSRLFHNKFTSPQE